MSNTYMDKPPTDKTSYDTIIQIIYPSISKVIFCSATTPRVTLQTYADITKATISFFKSAKSEFEPLKIAPEDLYAIYICYPLILKATTFFTLGVLETFRNVTLSYTYMELNFFIPDRFDSERRYSIQEDRNRPLL
ncbi:MAG: hypothetical protein ACFFFC_00715 [Candidatus Thorarchaeota archaeon]